MPFELTIAEGKGRGQKFEFEAPDVTIGRGAENDVVLYDPGVSRTHARIKLQGPEYFLLDNGSANGTELNGSIISGAQRLRDGDRIRLGPILFRFDQRRAPQSDSTRITSNPSQPPPAAPEARSQETRVTSMPAEQARAVAPKAGGALAQGAGAEVWQKLLALPRTAQFGLAAAVALLVALIALTAARGSKPKGLECPDVIEIDDHVASLTFGRGEVDVDCGRKVAFGFTAPPRTRALIHYAAARIAQPTEVEITLNGSRIGNAPPAGARGEEQLLKLPDNLLAADGRNVVTFKNAERKDWTISRVRVEWLAITPGDPVRARSAYDLGRRKLEERRVAPRNLYDAWKYFVEARRYLEGIDPHPALYGEVAQLIKDAEKDLEKDCSRLLFSAARSEKYGQDERAQEKYREAMLHFPGDEPSGCRQKAKERLASRPLGAQ